MHNYIIKGNHSKAIPVKSEMIHIELEDFIHKHSKKIHNDSYDVIFSIGAVEIVNPKVMSLNDFSNYGPYII